MLSKLFNLVVVICCLAFSQVSATTTPFPDENKNQTPIRVILNDWTSQRIFARVTGSMFVYMGYQVKYPFSNSNEQWGALSHGIDHVQIEVWEGTMAQMFDRMVSRGVILDAGSHSAKTREDWWYPLYVEELCPGLPDWRALRECSPLFNLGKGGNKGRFIAGPWEKPEAARIRALDLNFKVQRVKKADDLWRHLQKATKNRQAIVLFNWTPNWIEAVYPGKFIEFPTFSPECETDPSWGVNPNFHYDCGNPRAGWLKKAAWIHMPNRWPCAYQTLTQISFDNSTIAEVASWVDYHGMNEVDAAKRWLYENKSLWQSWIPDECLTNK